jgi:enolase
LRTLKLTVYLSYQGKTLPYYTYIQPVNQESEGGGAPITDFKEACRLINEEVSPLLKGKDVLALKKVDDVLAAWAKKRAEGGEQQVNEYILRACSEAVLYSYAQTVQPASPYQGMYRYLRNRDLTAGSAVPKIMFNVLNGGKALASKVKFSRFYLILDFGSTSPPEEGVSEPDVMEIFLKI